MYHLTRSKQGMSSIELGRRLGMRLTTAWKVKHELNQVMTKRDTSKRLTGRAVIDGAYLDGKRAWGAAGKTLFVAAVETTADCKPVRVELGRVNAFSNQALSTFARHCLASSCSAHSHSLPCFASAAAAECTDQAIKAGRGPRQWASQPSNGSTPPSVTSRLRWSAPTNPSTTSMSRATSPSPSIIPTGDTISPPCCRASAGRAFGPHPCPIGPSNWLRFTRNQIHLWPVASGCEPSGPGSAVRVSITPAVLPPGALWPTAEGLQCGIMIRVSPRPSQPWPRSTRNVTLLPGAEATVRSRDAPPQPLDQPRLVDKLRSYMDLSSAEVEALTRLMSHPRAVARGREVVVQGQPYRSLSVLGHGLALCYKVLPDGKRQVLHLVVPGDLIGLPACLFENSIAAVSCLTDCRIHAIGFADLFGLFRQHPRMGVALFWISAREAGIYVERLATMGRRSGYERMAHMILELLLRLQPVGLADASSFEMPMTQEMLADSLGLSLQHVNRMIRNLREEGLAIIEGHRVVIHDFDSLVGLAGFDGAYLRPQKIPGLDAS